MMMIYLRIAQISLGKIKSTYFMKTFSKVQVKLNEDGNLSEGKGDREGYLGIVNDICYSIEYIGLTTPIKGLK